MSSRAYCGSHVPMELKPRQRSDSCSISTMPSSSSNTQTVMASSELPRIKWPFLGGAIKVFMMNHWQGQCHNHQANGPALQFVMRSFDLEGISRKSTAGNQLRWGGMTLF